MDAEGADDFGDDVVEGAGFDAVSCSLCIAVHGVAAPEDIESGGLNGVGERREFGGNFVGTEAVNEGESAGFVGGVKEANGVEEFFGGDGVADFESDGVADTAAVFDVGAVEFAGAVSDPEHVGTEVVVTAGAFGASEGLFVVQE